MHIHGQKIGMDIAALFLIVLIENKPNDHGQKNEKINCDMSMQ